MSAVRHETYTSTEPDGTLVTTTTRTQTKYGYERVYGCGPGPLNEAYCCSPMGLLRIAEIIIGLVIVSLITAVYGPGPFKGILFGQTFLLIFAAVALCLTFMYLVVFFFELHRTHLEFWPWRTTDFIFCTVAAVLYLIIGFVEAYYATGAWANNCADIGSDGIRHNGCRTIYEWAFASLFCFINSGLYAISAFLAARMESVD